MLTAPSPSLWVALVIALLMTSSWLRWRGRRRFWLNAASGLGMVWEREVDAMRLTGIHRGRAVSILVAGGRIRAAVRIVNPARLIDELRSDEPLPSAPWLTLFSRAQLLALAAGMREDVPWHVVLTGHEVSLTSAESLAHRPGRLRFLVDLVCDLAEGADAISNECPAMRLAV